MIKNFLRSLLRVARLTVYPYGCTCSENIDSAVALNPYNTVKCICPHVSHEVLLLGDKKHLDEFIGDLSGHTIQSRYNGL